MFVFLDVKAVAGRFLTPTFGTLVETIASGSINFDETFLAGLPNFAFTYTFALYFSVAVDWRLPTLTSSLLYEGFVAVVFFSFGTDFYVISLCASEA